MLLFSPSCCTNMFFYSCRSTLLKSHSYHKMVVPVEPLTLQASVPELESADEMPPDALPPSPTWVLPLQRRAHGLGIHIPLPPWPSQEARLWGRPRGRDPRRGPGRPPGSVRSPSPSKRGWRLAPPSTLGIKNNCRGRRARTAEEAEEKCVICLAPLYDNTMHFRTACMHLVHAKCMKDVFEYSATTD